MSYLGAIHANDDCPCSLCVSWTRSGSEEDQEEEQDQEQDQDQDQEINKRVRIRSKTNLADFSVLVDHIRSELEVEFNPLTNTDAKGNKDELLDILSRRFGALSPISFVHDDMIDID